MTKASNMSGDKGRWVIGGLVVIGVVALGWYAGQRLGGPSSEQSADPDGGAGAEVYEDVAGRVIDVDRDKSILEVHHERIEGFMQSMVMDLQVAESVSLASVEQGDAIRFDLAHTGDTYEVIGIRPDDGAAEGGAGRAKAPDNPLERGDRVPDLVLFDAQGKRFRLRDMDAKRKVITFFYVRCPLEDFCPAQSRRMAELQDELEQGNSDVHLLSLSLDSGHDDADVLAEYGERFGADPSRWTLAGGADPEAVRQFAERAGAGVERQEDSFQIDHALIGLRVDGDRIVDRVYGLQSISEMIRKM